MTIQSEFDEMDVLKGKIHSITKYQKPYVGNSLIRIMEKGTSNVKAICEYIMAEQSELNTKESTKEGKIKCLVRFSSYVNHKHFQSVSKESVESCYTPKIHMHNGYVQYCIKYSLPAERYDSFCKVLKNQFNFQDAKPTINGERISSWKGIALSPSYAPKTQQKHLEVSF